MSKFKDGDDGDPNLWSQPAVAAIFPSGRMEVPDMPGRSRLISFLTKQVPYFKSYIALHEFRSNFSKKKY